MKITLNCETKLLLLAKLGNKVDNVLTNAEMYKREMGNKPIRKTIEIIKYLTNESYDNEYYLVKVESWIKKTLEVIETEKSKVIEN